MKRKQSVLAIAVATDVLAWVYLVDSELKDWCCLRKCVADPPQARNLMRTVIAEYEPDTIVTENPDRCCGKSGRALKLLRVLAQDAADQPGHHVRVVRCQSSATKYEEAKALAEQFPEFAPLLPEKPKLFVRERRRMIVFEALSLAAFAIVRR